MACKLPDRLSVREAITVAYDYTCGVMPAAYPGWRQTLADILATVG